MKNPHFEHEGHVCLPEITPPDKLYHGTASKYEESISKTGLKAKIIADVHLTTSLKIAEHYALSQSVRTDSSPIIYEIDAKSMCNDGYVFYANVNLNCYVTDNVPPKYLSIKKINK